MLSKEVLDIISTIAVANNIREPGTCLCDLARNIEDFTFDKLDKILDKYSYDFVDALKRHSYNPILKNWLKNYLEKRSEFILSL